MRIAQVTPYFYPHMGGVESHVLTLSRELVKRGHEVSIFTSNSENSKEKEFMDGIIINRLKPLFTLFNTPFIHGLKKSLLTHESDLIHAHVPPPFSEYFASRACQEKKTPFILTYHCDMEIPNILGGLITELYRRTLGLYSLACTDKIIVHTETYAATSRAVWKYDPIIIPSAINVQRFNPSINGKNVRRRHNLEDSKIVLYVGRIRFHKGLEYFVESAKYIDPNTKYLIVGEGNFKNTLKKLIKGWNLQDRIIFAGRVSNKDLPKYYASCDLFVLPSVSRLEAFGLVILEAMASGKPVIVSDIPGVREAVTPGVHGLLSEPVNAKDIAKKINTLLSDNNLRKRMGSNCRKKVEKYYSWEKVVKKIENVYKEVVD